jgi:hypothetical protein
MIRWRSSPGGCEWWGHQKMRKMLILVLIFFTRYPACWLSREGVFSAEKPPFWLSCISLLRPRSDFPPRPLCETETLAGCPSGSHSRGPVVRLAYQAIWAAMVPLALAGRASWSGRFPNRFRLFTYPPEAIDLIHTTADLWKSHMQGFLCLVNFNQFCQQNIMICTW